MFAKKKPAEARRSTIAVEDYVVLSFKDVCISVETLLGCYWDQSLATYDLLMFFVILYIQAIVETVTIQQR